MEYRYTVRKPIEIRKKSYKYALETDHKYKVSKKRASPLTIQFQCDTIAPFI